MFDQRIKHYLRDLSRADILRFALFVAGYFLSVQGSERLYGSLEVPSPFWFPDSILLCSLLLTRREYWWVFVLAIWPIRFVTGAPEGTPLWFLLSSIVNDSSKALISAWVLHRVFGRPVRLNTFREFMIFLSVAAGAVPLLSAIAAAPARHALGDPLWSAGYRWFLGDALAQVIVTPTLLYWCTRAYARVYARLTELVLMTAGLIAVSYYAFVADHASSTALLLYAPAPFLIWAAVRLRPLGAANAVSLVSFIAVLGAVNGTGIFWGSSSDRVVLSIQLFLLLLAVSSLSLAILIAERESRTQELEVLLNAAPITILIAADAECTSFRANHTGHRSQQTQGVATRAEESSLRRAAATGVPVFGDAFSWVLDDGTERHIVGNAVPLMGEDGKPCGAIGAFMDISEHKRVEAALRESQERFRLVADTAPVLIWMSGADKLCTFFTKGWVDFTGRSIGEQLGDGWSSGVHPDDLAHCLGIYSDAFDARRIFEREYRLRRFDGEYRWIADYGVPRFESDEGFCGYIGSCIDITDRKLVEEELQELSGRLIDAQEQERARIARELHDDFCQRMAFLQISIDQFRQSAAGLSSDARRQLRTIAEVTTQFSSDIRQLSHRLHPSTLEILGLVDTLWGLCQEFSTQQSMKVRFVHHDVPEHLASDVSGCLFRVAQEALRNVVKHSGVAEATVELSGHADGIELSVSDVGAGFDPDSVRRKPGIGLISMRERLRPIGGRLVVQSAPSRGTRIQLCTDDPRVTNALLKTFYWTLAVTFTVCDTPS